MLRNLLFIGKIEENTKKVWQTNFNLIEKDDCDSALDFIKRSYMVVSAILIDINMNEYMDFSFLENIKNNSLYAVVPVFCIADNLKKKEYAKILYNLGIVGIIDKDMDVSIQLKKVMNLIKIRENAEMQGLAKKKNTSFLYKEGQTISFWDEKSLDNIILHSYVGAACVFEYFNNEVIILRVNDQYEQEIFGQKGYNEHALAMDISKLLYSDDYQKIINCINEAIKKKTQITSEVILHKNDLDSDGLRIRITIRAIANVGERYLFFATILNFTKQYNDEVERKKAEKEKEEANEMIRCITDNINSGVAAITIENGIIEYLYVNDNYYKLFDYTKEQFKKELRNGVLDLVLEEDISKLKQETSFGLPEVFYRAHKRNGEIIWVKRNTSSFYKEDIKKTIYVSILSDVTTERKTEQRINSLNEKLIDSDVYFQLNLNTKTIEEFHTKFKSTIKLKAPFIYDEKYTDLVSPFIHEADRDIVLKESSTEQLKLRYLNGESKMTIDFRKKVGQDDYHWYRGTAILMKGIDAISINAFVYCNDIDIEKKNELAYGNIVDSEIETICVLNIKTKLAHLIKYYGEHENITVNTLFNYDEQIRNFIQHKIAEEDREKAYAYFNIDNMVSALENASSVTRSFWEELPDKPKKRKRMKATYLDDTHNDILLSGQYITALFEEEQRQQVILQRAVDSANDANKAKSEFLSRMSHDMRTPLNAIMGMVGLAKEEIKDNQVQEYLENIEISSQFLLGLINDILDLSKIESRKIVLKEAPFKIEEFKRNIDTVILPLMKAKNIEFIFDVRNNPQIIMVDKMRFTQIFFNLLSNASKFTNDGGRIMFCVEHIPDKAGKYGMRFKVSDNGIGMSEEFQKVLFNPFVQERNTGVDQGSGLGLAITKNLVETMGGTIKVESKLGVGTTFIVDLYAYVEEEYVPNIVSDSDIDIALKNIKALIVDDKEINLYLIEKILEAKGCFVTMASNGKEAVEIFKRAKEGSFDVILTDIRMPIMDGFEEAKAIRALDRKDAKSIPIIAVTADLYDDEKITGDITNYLPKPLDKNLMYRMIYETLKNKQNKA